MKTLLLALMLASLPIVAHAGCAPGQTPANADIEMISVTRHGYPILSRPTYEFSLTTFANRVVASLNAERSVPLKGEYELRDPRVWDEFVSILDRDGFSTLRLTPDPNFALLDPPVDLVSVTRCKVTTSIGLGSTLESVVEDAQFRRYLGLLADLQAAIFALPWRPVPTPTP